MLNCLWIYRPALHVHIVKRMSAEAVGVNTWEIDTFIPVVQYGRIPLLGRAAGKQHSSLRAASDLEFLKNVLEIMAHGLVT